MSWKGGGGGYGGGWGAQQQQWGGNAGKGAQQPWQQKPQQQQPWQPKGAAVQKAPIRAAIPQAPDKSPEFKAKVVKQTKEVENAEKVTKTVLDSSKTVLENEKATSASLSQSLAACEKQQTKLNDMMKVLSTDSADARKAGNTSAAPAAELAKLLTKVRGLWQNVTSQVNKLKPKATKLAAEAELKKKEDKDTAAFKAVLAKVKGEVTTAENAANAVSKSAAPLVSKPPDEGEERDKKVEAIEKAATEALTKLDKAKAEVTDKTKSIQTYAPEAKKASLASLMELQKKITDGVRAMNIYKSFKTHLPRLAEHQKTITEVTETLAGHDAAITKANDVAKAATLTKSKVEAIDKHLEPVQAAIKAAASSLMKLRQADSATQVKVTTQRTRMEELKKKVEAVTSKIKGQRDAIKAEESVDSAKEQKEAAETAWKECQEAEMPFLMGVEVLASEENDKALEACKVAGEAMAKAVNAAKNFIRTSLGHCKSYEKELAASTSGDLNPLLKELDALDTKYSKYRKELDERKMLPILSPAIDAVEAFGKSVKTAEGGSKKLTDSGLEDESVEKISEAIEAAKTVADEAEKARAEAQKLAQGAQQKSRAKHNHPSIVSMNEGLAEGSQKLQAVRSAMNKAQTVLKSKKAVSSGEEKVKEGEEGAKKAKKLMPDGKVYSMEQTTALEEACAAARKMITAAGGVIQPHLFSAPTKAKADLQKLMDRKKAAEAEVAEVVNSTKDNREAARTKHFLEEGETKTKAAEAAGAKLDEAEAPFLIGNALGSSKATQELLDKCSEAAKAVQEAVGAAKSFNSSSSNQTRGYGEAAAKSAKDGFQELNTRLSKVSTKLATFEKDSRERTKEAKMVEAGEKTDELEATQKNVVAAAEPFNKEGADKMTEAEADAPLKAFMEVDQKFTKDASTLLNFLQIRLKEQAANKDHVAAVKGYQERLTKAKEEVVEKKKGTKVHEKRALATRLLAEAKEEVGGLEAEVKKAKDACGPLLEEGGEQFLIGNSVVTLAKALQAHMKAKELTVEAVFKDIGKKRLDEKAFVKYLTDLPAAIDHDELSAFSDERRLAIFKRLAGAKGVGPEEFGNIFRQESTCIKGTVLTNKAEVEGSETLCKVEASSTIEVFGKEKADDAKLTRSECKVGEQTGWITIKQDNVKFVISASPFKTFIGKMDKALNEGTAIMNKVQNSLFKKMNQGGKEEEGPLKDAREGMAKLKDEVAKQTKAMEELRKTVATAKHGFTSKEQSEKNAHIEARNAKEAAPFLADPTAKFAALEADAKAAEEAAAPMISLTGDELQNFATPASVAEAVETLAASVKEKAEAVRESVKEQTKAVSEVTPQSGGTGEAKKQLRAITMKVDELTRKTNNSNSKVSGKCKSLVASKLDPTADAIRKFAAKKGKTIEDFFKSLAKGEKIPEAAFCKMLTGLEADPALSPEMAKLVCRKLEADGISEATFTKYVVLYYKVVRTIAFTDAMDITSCKTLRKGEEGEVVEVLEGPVTDPANSMTRIHARSLNEDKQVGWITLSGSKGTAFLEKTNKPAAPKPAAAAAKPAAAAEKKA